MNFVLRLTTTLLYVGLLPAASVPPSTAPRSGLQSAQRKQIVDTKVRLPLVFEPNVRQDSSDAQWVSRTLDGTLLLKPTGATLIVRGAEKENQRVTMRIVGARDTATAEPEEPLPSYSNYFIGNDRSKWRTRVPHFAKLKYKNVYPGIDLLYYGADRRFEYDFILSPGVSHSIIELAFDGADKLNVDRKGDLIIQIAGTTIRQFRPKVYQWIDGKQQAVEGAYRISTDDRVHFALGRYDRLQPLVIDPVLQYSTYVGGSGHERGTAVAVDRSGAAYITGQTNSRDLGSAFRDQRSFGGDTDAMVAKLSSFSEMVEWISYFGGATHDVPTGIGVDASGNVLITGWTQSSDLPLRNPAQTSFGGIQDAFVAKFVPNGTELVYATYLGGTCPDEAQDIAVDSNGNAYVVGFTSQSLATIGCSLSSFPVVNSYQAGGAGGGGDVFVTKLPPSGSPLAYSTYVGAEGRDIGTGIAVDSRGAAYVTGHTTSSIFPVMLPAQLQNRGGGDTFLFKLIPAGNSLEYSTFYGGTLEDIAFSVAIDGTGNAYVTGTTTSTDFPVVNAAQTASRGSRDAFVFKVNATGSQVAYATYLGGDRADDGTDVAVDSVGTAYVAGRTESLNFPSTSPFQQQYGEGRADAFVARLSQGGNSLLYSTYLGGRGEDAANSIAVDGQGAVTVLGWTESSDLPAVRGAFNSGGVSPGDVFVARVSPDTSVTLLGATPAQLTFTGGAGQTIASQTITLASTGAPLTFTVGSNVPWAQVTASQLTTPATLTISVVPTGLPVGAQSAEITVNAPPATSLRIPITFNVTAVPVIGSVSPSPIPSGQDTRITVTGTGFINNSQLFANNSPLPTTFVNATSLQATVPAVLVSGTTPLQLTVRNPEAVSAAFSVQVGTANPSITASGIVNTATGLAGSMSAGQLVSIFGRDFGPDRPVSAVADAAGTIGTTLAETRVLFDGIAAPILSVSANQVNVIVPGSIAGKTSVQVEVEYRGRRSTPVSLGIGPATPGLFTASSTGVGQAAASNQNFTPNAPSNPAVRGSVLVIYATGVGPTTPASIDGRITPPGAAVPMVDLPVAVEIGGVPAEVLFAGSAPGLVSGTVQINVRIAENVTPGDAVPVLLTVGTAQSRPGVTVAIR